jgi:tRNA G10  N-methylase Trm11
MMMSYVGQETLTEDTPLIIDTTCSFRKHWPKFATIRMDVREVCSPDIVCDARFLPFRDGVADELYCDPPHFVRRGAGIFTQSHEEGWLKTIIAKHRLSGRVSPDEFTRYGWWRSKKEWKEFVGATTDEFARVLKPGGELHYKLTDTRDKRDPARKDLDAYLSRFEMVSERITRSKSNRKKNGGRDSNLVYWPMFKK